MTDIQKDLVNDEPGFITNFQIDDNLFNQDDIEYRKQVIAIKPQLVNLTERINQLENNYILERATNNSIINSLEKKLDLVLAKLDRFDQLQDQCKQVNVELNSKLCKLEAKLVTLEKYQTNIQLTLAKHNQTLELLAKESKESLELKDQIEILKKQVGQTTTKSGNRGGMPGVGAQSGNGLTFEPTGSTTEQIRANYHKLRTGHSFPFNSELSHRP